MNWTDKELDELARKAEANQTFAYQDSFWAEMEAMLPAKKKRIWPILLLAAVPALGTIAFFTQHNPTEIVAENGAKTMNFDKEVRTESIEIMAKYSAVSSQQSSTSSDEISNQNTAQSNPSKASEINYAFTDRNSAQRMESNQMENSSLDAGMTDAPISKSAPYLIDGNLSSLGDESVIPQAEKADISRTDSPSISIALEPENTEMKSTLIGLLPFAALETFEFGQNLLPTALYYRSPKRFYAAYTELGVGLGEAYISEQIGHTRSISMGAGVRYTKKSLFAQAGLGFETEKVAVELSQRSRIYGFDMNTFENNLSYKNMYRLNLPINIGYAFAKHSMQTGVSMSYLMGAKMKYLYLENEKVVRDEMQYATTKGWNPIGLKMNVGYGYNLLPSTTIGANFQIQLLKQLDRNWVNAVNRNPISGQLFVRKTIR